MQKNGQSRTTKHNSVVQFAKTWATVCRGFHQNNRGPIRIMLKGQMVRGFWVYGHPIPTKKGLTLLYGSDIWSEAPTGEKPYEVLPDTICRCTGLLANGFPLFEYDVVDATISVQRESAVRTYNFPDSYIFWNPLEMSWNVKTTNGKEFHANYQWVLRPVGTIFDSKER